MHKFFIIILTLFITSCVNEVTLVPSTHFGIENVQVEVDKFENELFLQAEVDYWNGIENIAFVQAELSIYQSGGYQSIGSFNLFDDGSAGGNGDIIPENGIYSLLTTADQLDISDIEAEIKSINMANHYELAQSESDSLDIELIVSGKSLRVIFTAEDIEGISAKYIGYINLSNTYIEIRIDADGMYVDNEDSDDLDDIICEREWNVNNDGFFYYFNIISSSQLNNSNNFIYSTKIPFTPLDECGGTGEALFKFSVHDMDFSNCLATLSNECLGNFTSSIERSLIITGCGDGYCTPIYEGSTSCSEDCE